MFSEVKCLPSKQNSQAEIDLPRGLLSHCYI